VRGSAFDAFLQAGRDRRERPGPTPADRAVHSDPDPDAITRLAPRRRPAARFLARRGGRPKSRETLAWQIQNSCRLLQEASAVPAADYRSAEEYPWHHIDRDHADRFRQLVHTRYPNVGTRNAYISVVREVLRECFRAELISALRFEELAAALPTKVALRTSRGRRLTPEEVARLLRACLADIEPVCGARDAAVIAVFATTGIRSSDLEDLNLTDWDPDDRSLYLACTKNGHPHTVYLPDSAVDYLKYWLTRRGAEPGPLFTKVIGEPLGAMTYATVRSMLRTRADQADVKRFGSHDFRRTVATTLLRTHDTGIVSRILGHRDVASTAVYDLTGPEECRAAVETLPMPAHPGTDSEPDEDEEKAA
jgi:integrase